MSAETQPWKYLSHGTSLLNLTFSGCVHLCRLNRACFVSFIRNWTSNNTASCLLCELTDKKLFIIHTTILQVGPGGGVVVKALRY